MGLAAYPVLESADIFALNADIVPVGKDNIDHIKIAQEIISYLNEEFNAGFKVPKYITTDNNHIVGIDGSNKMSKSLNNAVYIRDSKEEVEEKVLQMKWVDFGQNELNVVIEYIRIFSPKIYPEIFERYEKGLLTEKIAKELLIDILNKILEPMRMRMKPYIEDKTLVFDLLCEGTDKVRKIADESMLNLREKIGLVNLEKQKKVFSKVYGK